VDCEEGSAFYLVGDDRPGALEETLKKVADAGINLDAIECVAAGAKFGCFIWVSGRDEERLRTLLT